MVISRKDMEGLDRRAIEGFGIDSLILMENAGMAVFNLVKDYDTYTIVCGSGNNGGDGLVVARHLILKGKGVDVFIIKDAKTLEAKKNLEILGKLTDRIFYIREEGDLDLLKESLKKSDLVLDSIFGIGLDREVRGISREVIRAINEYGKYIVAVDVPSGLEADTGQALGISILAHETIAIHEEKFCAENVQACGKTRVVYIGIPDERFAL